MDDISIRYRILDNIISITDRLNDIKDELYIIELMEGKSNKYYEMLDNYKKILLIENEVYDNICMDGSMLLDYFEYIYIIDII